VDLFFVLSGFILTYVYRAKFSSTLKTADFLGFMKYRFARLYPVHLITMLVMLVLFVVGRRLGTLPTHTQAFTPLSTVANLTLTQAWFPPYVAAMNGPAWSISAEWFAYLLFPLTYFSLNRTTPLWPWLVIAISATLSFNRQDPSQLLQIALDFPVGMAAFAIYSKFGHKTGRWGSFAAVGMIIASTYLLSSTDPTPLDKIHTGGHLRTGIILAAVLLLISLAARKDALGRLLSTRAAVYAGEISYSVYMCHWAVWTILRKGLPHFHAFQSIPHVTLMLMAAMVTILCSILCYHFIEVPGRALIRNIDSKTAKRFTVSTPAKPEIVSTSSAV
jgi:peptidoglycan/LPS O-acetylase OafA/YrhL